MMSHYVGCAQLLYSVVRYSQIYIARNTSWLPLVNARSGTLQDSTPVYCICMFVCVQNVIASSRPSDQADRLSVARRGFRIKVKDRLEIKRRQIPRHIDSAIKRENVAARVMMGHQTLPCASFSPKNKIKRKLRRKNGCCCMLPRILSHFFFLLLSVYRDAALLVTCLSFSSGKTPRGTRIVQFVCLIFRPLFSSTFFFSAVFRFSGISLPKA